MFSRDTQLIPTILKTKENPVRFLGALLDILRLQLLVKHLIPSKRVFRVFYISYSLRTTCSNFQRNFTANSVQYFRRSVRLKFSLMENTRSKNIFICRPTVKNTQRLNSLILVVVIMILCSYHIENSAKLILRPISAVHFGN